MENDSPQLHAIPNEEELLLSAKKGFEEVLNTMIEKYKQLNQSSQNANASDVNRIYESKIKSLTEELNQVKKENESLKEELQKLNPELNKVERDNQNFKSIMEMISHIKGDINDIKGIYFGKENNLKSIQRKINKQIRNELKINSLSKLEHEIQIENIHSDSSYFASIMLHDKRIVGTGLDGKSISICSINWETKSWKQDIKKENAHSAIIRSFAELSDDRLLSSSGDKTIKIWKILPNDLTEIKTLTEHSNNINRIIVLNNDRFASGSDDKTIRIWSSKEPYNIITTFNSKAKINNLLYLEKQEKLVSSCWESGLEFWNLINYKRDHFFQNVYTTNSITSMIELPDSKIAVSSGCYPFSIEIIDSYQYKIIKSIKMEDFNGDCSALCLLDNYSFIYTYYGFLLQISTIDYSILFVTNNEKHIKGTRVLLSVNDGEYIVIENKYKGFNIIKPCYCC